MLGLVRLSPIVWRGFAASWPRQFFRWFNSVNSRRNNADTHPSTHLNIQGRAHDNIGLCIDFFANSIGRLVQFEQGKITAARDIDQNALSAAQADFIQQRVGNCFFGRTDSTIFALGLAGAHHRLAHLIHHRPHIGKVQIDQAGTHHQICHPFDALI